MPTGIIKRNVYLCLIALLFITLPGKYLSGKGNNRPPSADAGTSRYAAYDAVTLDGSGSSDPDGDGITYRWTQVAGPTVNIHGADTAVPVIDGFIPTGRTQTCRFQLVVNDGAMDSTPDEVDVFIVRDYDTAIPGYPGNQVILRNPPFDPSRPTILYFGGGDCSCGGYDDEFDFTHHWYDHANMMVVYVYCPPYTLVGDMFVSYMSALYPDYREPVQFIGFSTGCNAAIVVGNYVNLNYPDPRFAVNRVTLLDPVCGEYDFAAQVQTFNANPVGGETAWVDNYRNNAPFIPGALNISFPDSVHYVPFQWYLNSALEEKWPNGNLYNNGVTAGFYISVAGPGKYLDLATDKAYYHFKKNLAAEGTGFLEFYDFDEYPGALPQPVELVGAPDGTPARNNVLMTATTSENAVEYEFVVGHQPGAPGVNLGSGTLPPVKRGQDLTFSPLYWTVRAKDAYGTTVYPSPRYLTAGASTEKLAVHMSAPVPGSVVSGKVDIRVTAKRADGSGANVNGMYFYIGEQLVHSTTAPPWSYLWDTSGYANRGQVIRVRVTDSSGLESTVMNHVTVQNMKIGLQASRKEERAWMIRSSFIELRAEITLNLGGQETAVPVDKYVIYRKPVDNVMETLREFRPADISGNIFSFMDTAINRDKRYTYKVAAVDGTGKEIASSSTVTL